MVPLAFLALPAPDQEWRRTPALGVEYRMVVRADPPRTVVALRFAPGSPYRAVAAPARGTVYDLTPTNGRATLSEIVRTSGAAAGVNGDFFQFGDDPGGDPVNLMVRDGELLSAPDGASGGRNAAYAWGPGGFVLARPTWRADCELGAITGLNGVTEARGLTLSTASAGYAVSRESATFLVLRVGSAVLRPKGEVVGTVLGLVEGGERLAVQPGTAVLSSRSDRDALRAVRSGQRIHLRTDVMGADWRRFDQAVGGGPLLLRGGRSVAPDAGEFALTRHPRTALGRDAAGGVWYVVVDGRQKQSVGASLAETAEVMRGLGCVEAINLDGGGSSTLSLFGMVLNRPSGGVERAIGNAVLLFGPRPMPIPGALRIVLRDARLAVLDAAGRPVAGGRVVWSAQGKAWVDGDGVLHPLEAGATTVRALVDGRLVEAVVTLPAK